jgi:transposase
MESRISNSPSEIESLHKLIASLQGKNRELFEQNNNLSSSYRKLSKQNSALLKKNTELLERINKLEEQLKLLKAKRFGKSSEKLERQIDIVERLLEEEETLLGFQSKGNFTLEGNVKEKGLAKRKKLPEHLPREDVVLEPESRCESCGGEKFRQLGEDISEILEHIPETFKVIRYIRPRCVCIDCEKIAQAYPASKVIDKGNVGPGLLAHIFVQKFCNHLPTYRQSQIYAREGLELSRSTISSWLGQGALLLEPIAEKIREYILSASHIHGDDTPVKVLEPGSGKTKTGRIWVYVKDGRPRNDKSPIAACYYYSPDRKGIRPKEHLKDFTGTLHADAYSGYNKLYLSTDNPNATINEAGCWAHARRKFYDITIANDKANIAFAVLEKIGEIYQVECEVRGLDPGQRLEAREKKSVKLVNELFSGFKKAYSQLPKKSSTAQAIAYAINNEAALKRFLKDGNIEIDNNAAERALRSVAVGRKNWLFAGSDNGGNTAAIIYTVIETAKLNNINPAKYLRKVFNIIQDYNSTKLDELLPWNIKLE